MHRVQECRCRACVAGQSPVLCWAECQPNTKAPGPPCLSTQAAHPVLRPLPCLAPNPTAAQSTAHCPQVALGYDYLKNTLHLPFPDHAARAARAEAERREAQARQGPWAVCVLIAGLGVRVRPGSPRLFVPGLFRKLQGRNLTAAAPGVCAHLGMVQAQAQRGLRERYAQLCEEHAARAAQFRSFLDQMVRQGL